MPLLDPVTTTERPAKLVNMLKHDSMQRADARGTRPAKWTMGTAAPGRGYRVPDPADDLPPRKNRRERAVRLDPPVQKNDTGAARR
jgi:hypothetical protein